MHVALCLYGQPRQAHKGYLTFRDWMKNNPTVTFDVYFHAWMDPEQQRYAASPWRHIPDEDLVVNPQIIPSLVEAYRPVSYLVEKPKASFPLPENLETSPFWSASSEAVQSNLHNTLSQLYSRQAVRDLVWRTNRQYDLIVISRFDFLRPLPPSLSLAHMEPSRIHVSNMHHPRYIFPDNLIISSPSVFFSLFNLYNDLPLLLGSASVLPLLGRYRESPSLSGEALLFANFLLHFGRVEGLVNYTGCIPDFH